MADIVKTGWFGRQVTVLMMNGKTVSGELSETADRYIVITRKDGTEMQIMGTGIIGIWPAKTEGQS